MQRFPIKDDFHHPKFVCFNASTQCWLCKQDAGQRTPPPPARNCLPGQRQDCNHHLSTGDGGRKPQEPTGCGRQASARCPGHHPTTLSPAGFNEVRCPQDSSVGTPWVISYLWRYELCLCYCLHTFLSFVLYHSLKEGKLYLQEPVRIAGSAEACVFLSVTMFSRINESILFFITVSAHWWNVFCSFFQLVFFTAFSH